MAQVRPLSCACAICTDLSRLQLAVSFQLISSCGMCRSLHHPYHFASQLPGRHLHRSDLSDHSRHLLTRLACPSDLLALELDIACLFQLCAHSCSSWDVSHRIRRGLQRFRGPIRPQRLSTTLHRLYGLLSLYLDPMHSFRRQLRSHRLWGLLGR